MKKLCKFYSCLLLVLFVMLCAVVPAPCSTRVDLKDHWRFRTDPSGAGESLAWSSKIPADTEEVTLPHTWNMGKNVEYQGQAWYFKTFPISDTLHAEHVEIHFGATFYKARVWLNGVLLGSHEGGYSAYSFDLTPYLKENNLLAVEIDNRAGIDTIPGWPLKASSQSRIYDWWPYGGIVRGAWLTVGSNIVVRWQHIDSTLVDGNAQIKDNILVENAGRRTQTLVLHATAYSEEGGEVGASTPIKIEAAPGKHEVSVPLTIRSPKRWGFDNPYLYQMVVTAQTPSGKALDSVTDNFGVRTIEIRDRHLYLNGDRVRLSGLTRHEESPWEGLAETAGTIKHDFDDLKNLQTTLTRPVHYQQSPIIYDFADRNGILMIPEVPMWQFSEEQMKNPKVIALAKQMLTEMIDQNYNHPSIFAWSVDNESATDTPGGIAYFKTMYALAKRLNPARPVSFADDRIAFVKDPKTNASSMADFIMWNEYFGTWDGPESLLPAAFDRIEKGYPDKMVIVSEFGTPGLFASNPTTADLLRVRTIRKHLALFAQHDWIAGAILWCYEDYPSYHNHWPGQEDHYVDHGVVDKNRQRKPSYYVWQQENEPAHLQVAWTYNADGTPDGFAAEIARRPATELPSYPLINYEVRWRVIDEAGKQIASGHQTLPEIGDSQHVGSHWNLPKGKYFRLELHLDRPTGFQAMERMLTWKTPETGGFNGDSSN